METNTNKRTYSYLTDGISYYAVKSEKIDIYDLSECYDKHGNKIGSYDAGVTKAFTATCKAINYFDGSNWRSIILEIEIEKNDCEYMLVEDEEIIKKIDELIDGMEYISKHFGVEIYECGDYTVYLSSYASDNFCDYEIRKEK